MTSTYTTNLRLVQPADGDLNNTWGDTINAGFTALVDQAVSGVTSVVLADANHTLTYTNGATDEARSAMLIVTGALTATRAVIAPTGVSKLYVVYNNTSGGQAITIGMATGAVTTIPNGKRMLVYIDGTNSYEAVEYINTASLGSLSLSGGLTGTTASFSGNVGTTAGALVISGAASTGRGLLYETAGTNRWDLFANATPESGADVGSDFVVARYNDAGTLIDSPLVITRSTGLATFADGLTVSGTLTATLTGNVTGNVSGTAGTLANAHTIAMTGDVGWTSGAFDGSGNVTGVGTLATVNTNVGTYGSSAAIPIITVNGKGLITAVTTATPGAAQAAAFTGQQTSGTPAGETLVNTSWTTRTVNNTVFNGITSASLGLNQITLPAGTYNWVITASALGAASAQSKFQTRLRNTTDSTTALVSPTMDTPPSLSQAVTTTLAGQTTIAGTKVFEVDTYTSSTGNCFGGTPISSGEAEVYVSIFIQKVA